MADGVLFMGICDILCTGIRGRALPDRYNWGYPGWNTYRIFVRQIV